MKRSKKHWDRTKSQLRKDYSKRNSHCDNIPSWFTRYLHKENKTHEKRYLHKVIKGFDIDYLNLKVENKPSSAGWDWF